MEYFQGNLIMSNLYLHLGTFVNSVPGLAIALTERLFLGRWEGLEGQEILERFCGFVLNLEI